MKATTASLVLLLSLLLHAQADATNSADCPAVRGIIQSERFGRIGTSTKWGDVQSLDSCYRLRQRSLPLHICDRQNSDGTEIVRDALVAAELWDRFRSGPTITPDTKAADGFYLRVWTNTSELPAKLPRPTSQETAVTYIDADSATECIVAAMILLNYRDFYFVGDSNGQENIEVDSWRIPVRTSHELAHEFGHLYGLGHTWSTTGNDSLSHSCSIMDASGTASRRNTVLNLRDRASVGCCDSVFLAQIYSSPVEYLDPYRRFRISATGRPGTSVVEVAVTYVPPGPVPEKTRTRVLRRLPGGKPRIVRSHSSRDFIETTPQGKYVLFKDVEATQSAKYILERCDWDGLWLQVDSTAVVIRE